MAGMGAGAGQHGMLAHQVHVAAGVEGAAGSTHHGTGGVGAGAGPSGVLALVPAPAGAQGVAGSTQQGTDEMGAGARYMEAAGDDEASVAKRMKTSSSSYFPDSGDWPYNVEITDGILQGLLDFLPDADPPPPPLVASPSTPEPSPECRTYNVIFYSPVHNTRHVEAEPIRSELEQRLKDHGWMAPALPMPFTHEGNFIQVRLVLSTSSATSSSGHLESVITKFRKMFELIGWTSRGWYKGEHHLRHDVYCPHGIFNKIYFADINVLAV